MRHETAAALVCLIGIAACRPITPPAAVSGAAAVVPMTLVNNLPVAAVRVNDSAPLAFIVDTGAAATVIHSETARTLGIRAGSATEATTGGGAIAASDLGRVTIEIGAFHLAVDAIGIDLGGLQAGLGHRVDGILGFELFERFVTQFDYPAGALRLRDQSISNVPSSAIVLPLRLEDRIPFTTIRVRADDGRWVDAEVEFDTGQSGALTLHRPYLQKERILGQPHAAVNITTGAIVAGAVPAQVTRLPAVRLGLFELDSPIVTVPPTPEAAGVAGEVAGILGGDLLRRFRVTVDYRQRQAVLEPAASAAAPFVFDAAGLSLAAVSLSPPEYRVRSLIEGSPAREAGIEVGDVLIAIDGAPAATMRLTEIRERLRQPDSTLQLTFVRAGQNRTVTIVTRRLV